MKKGKTIRKLFTLALLSGAQELYSAESQVEVIYGQDNRKEATLHANKQLRALAPAVAGRLRKSEVSLQNGFFNLPITTLKSSMGVCSSEKFSSQRVAVECTGFLISPDTLVTAGHCMQDANDCAAHYWAFDFQHTTQRLAESQVFECDKIVAQALNATDDYAVIKLKKAALGRTPLVLRSGGSISSSDSLAVIGHPSGLPMKIADKGKVRSINEGKNFFVAELDTYGGNSGSPVINTQTLQVEGILVRGENDYKYDSRLGCYKSQVCATGTCRGEDVTKITSLPLQR